MNIVVNCELVLSKKLEALCQQGEPIYIYVAPVGGNKAMAQLRMSVKDDTTEKDVLKVGETSLILRVRDFAEDVKEITAQAPQGQIFGTGSLRRSDPAVQQVGAADPDVPAGDPHPLTEKLEAKAKAREEKLVHQAKEAVQRTVVARPQQQAPQAGPKVILSIDQLQAELNGVANIDADIPQMEGKARTKEQRQQAIRIEMAVPKLKAKVYIRNKTASRLVIDDIKLGPDQSMSLAPHEVTDMSRFPAKLIRDSGDLMWCLENGKVDFATNADFVRYVKSLNKDFEGHDHGLPVFDSKHGEKDMMGSEGLPDDREMPSVNADDAAENAAEDYEGDANMTKLVNQMRPE
jgi:hypothetical protein